MKRVMPIAKPKKKMGNPNWVKGVKAHPGRQKGSQNKTTRLLKTAILQAAENTGDLGADGKGGLVGYLQYMARREPKAMAMLLGKVLPLQITDGEGNSLNDREKISEKMTVQECMALYHESLRVVREETGQRGSVTRH